MELLRSINEELKEKQQLDEVGLLKRAAGKVAGRLPGQTMKGKSANIEAQHQADQKVKQLQLDFQKWAGSQGKSAKALTAKDLHTYLSSKGLVAPDELKTAGKKPIAQIDKNAIKGAFNTAIKGTVKTQARTAATAAKPGETPQQPQQQGQQQQGQQQQGQQQQGQQQTQQTFKTYVDKMEQLLAQMKQAVPA